MTEQTPAPLPRPWLQRPDEDREAFYWFYCWLRNGWDKRFNPNLDPIDDLRSERRSIAKTAEFYAVPLSTMERQAADHEWTWRAKAYDDFLMERYLGNRLTSIEENRIEQDRLIRDSNAAVALALEVFRTAMLPAGSKGQADAMEKLRVMRIDIPKLFDISRHYANEAHKVEKGKPSDEANTATEAEVWDFSDFTPDDLKEYRRLRRLAGLDA